MSAKCGSSEHTNLEQATHAEGGNERVQDPLRAGGINNVSKTLGCDRLAAYLFEVSSKVIMRP